MKSFQIPFSNYDIFGYILPGLCFALGLLVAFSPEAKDLLVSLNQYQETSLSVKIVVGMLSSVLSVIALYFMGQIIGCVAHLLYDRLIVRHVLGYPFQHLLGMSKRKGFMLFRKLTSTDSVISNALKKKFDDKLFERIKLHLDDFDKSNSDLYWIVQVYVTKNEKSAHSKKLGIWLDMIGCLRNYSGAFLILSLIEIIRFYCSCVCARPFYAVPVIAVFLLLSLLFFMRYWVMYYAYYSKYIIRVYALEDLSDNEK